MIECIAALSGMQNITVLHLEHALPGACDFLSGGGLHPSPKIHLLCLADLAVIAPLSTVIVLLSCINIPPTTLLHLARAFELRSSVSDCSPISSFLAQQFSQRSSGPIFRSLVLDANVYPNMTFGLDPDLHPSGAEVGSNIPLKISFEETEDRITDETDYLLWNDVHHIMRDICCSLPLTNVQSLHIISPDFSPNLCKDILGRLDALRYMKLSCDPMPDLSLLSLAVPESNENPSMQHVPDRDPTSGHMFVPVLEELELHEISFIPDDPSVQSDFMSQRSFFDALSTRKGLQDRLIITECKANDYSYLSTIDD